jgi:hypothetical protein
MLIVKIYGYIYEIYIFSNTYPRKAGCDIESTQLK